MSGQARRLHFKKLSLEVVVEEKFSSASLLFTLSVNSRQMTLFRGLNKISATRAHQWDRTAKAPVVTVPTGTTLGRGKG